MGIQLAVLEVAFTSTGASKVQSDVAGVGAAIDEAGAASAGTLTTLAGASGLMADAFLGFSVKSAASFQTLMNTIQSNTTLSNSDMTQLASSVKSMATESGASMDQLGAAYMHATNFGFSFADSQKIVTAAMQSAVSTGSNVGDTANVLAGAMKEFGISAADAGHAMDVLHESAATGNMTLEQLVDSSGKMLSTAANLHVPLVDVAAGMSALTEHGFTAANAGVAMTNMMTKIIAPSAGASKELAALSKTTGIDLVSDFTSAGLATKGMPAILDDISRATGGNADTLHKLFPELRSFQGALALTGTAAGDYSKELGLMNDAMSGKITPTADAYNRSLGTLGNQMSRLGAAVHVIAIDIGSVLLPPLSALAGFAADAAEGLVKLVNAAAPLAGFIVAAVGAIGTFAGGMAVLNSAFVAGIPLLGGMIAAISPVLVPVLAIAAALAALAIAWQENWGNIHGAFTAAWNDIQPGLHLLSTALGDVQAALGAAFKGDWSGALRDLGNAAGLAGQALQQIGSALLRDIQKPDWGAILGDVGGDIGKALTSATSISGDLAQWLAGQIAGINWTTVWRGIQNAGSSVLRGLTAGANITVQLAQWLAQQVANLPWSTVWAGIQSAGGAILAGLEAGADITAQLGSWLGQQVAGIDWAAVWSNAKGAAGAALGAITSAAQGAGNAVVSGTKATANAVQQHQSTIEGAASGIGSALSGAGSDALAGLQAGLSGLGALAAGPLSQVKQLVSNLGDAINQKLGPAKGVIDGLVAAFAGMVTGNISQIGSLVEALASGLAKLVTSNVGPALAAIGTAADQMGTAFSRWTPLIGDLGKTLDSLEGPAGAVAVVLSGVLLAALTAVGSAFEAAGAVISAALPGAFEVAQGTITTFLGIFETISSIVAGVVAVVGDLLSGNWSLAWKDAQTAVSNVVTGITTILSGIGGIFSGLIAAATGVILLVWTAGWNLLAPAVATAISAVETLAGSIGGRVVAAVGDLGGLLVGIGASIIQGLISGIESQLGPLGSVLSGIGSFITSHKGPPSYDAVMLVPAGVAIMGSLIDGLTSQLPALQTAVLGVGNQIVGTFGSQNFVPALANIWRGVASANSDTNAQIVGDTQQTTGSLTDLYAQSAQSIVVSFDQVGKHVKDMTSENVTALSSMFRASEDLYKDQQTAADLANNNYKDSTRVVTDQMLADDRTRADSARQLAQALIGQAQDAAAQVIAAYQAQQDAGGAGASAVLDANLKAAEGVAQAVQQMADSATSSWKSATAQMVSDTRTMATQIKDALKAVNTTTGDIGKNQAGLSKSLLGDTAQTALTVTPQQLAGDQGLQQGAMDASIQASAQADVAYKTLLADQQAYYAALQQGNIDLASSIYARIPAEQAAADAARTAAETAQQAASAATTQVKSDQTALKQGAADLAQFTLDKAHQSQQAQANGYKAMYETLQTNAQAAYATLQRGIAGYEAAIKSGDAVAQDFYKHIIDGATKAIDLDQRQSDAVLKLNESLKQTAPTATTAAQAASSAVLAASATPTVSPTDAATEAGKRLGEMFARGALAMQSGADMPSAADWFQRMALGQNPFGGQQPPIEIHTNLYLDGEVVANQTQSVYAKQLRMNAPLVGAERVR